MAKVTKGKLEAILTSQLGLEDPRFLLEKVGSRLVGNIISPTFRGKGDYERQKLIWDALEKGLGAESSASVGMLLAYTPEEWDLGTESTAKPRKRVG